ncbi:hypothetical protein GCM10010168_85440 [Actinoplanes ianthinogenes]|uniref:Uncharacterized protein n=1 Tax=Actinoplanes ianthinogenes TaxID=122358 RepID=A0ABM7M109_9ACTN|nr:hypothetical protein [Actinoplanes ianthinogenes]BCJ45275.1 hypothetical protein Aiant_59320 [Actinoplanes ianthinogenes]GGR53471.1 hypothetical protein GCM10010168_85440 [Actinoplanes ianthinogenes]
MAGSAREEAERLVATILARAATAGVGAAARGRFSPKDPSRTPNVVSDAATLVGGTVDGFFGALNDAARGPGGGAHPASGAGAWATGSPECCVCPVCKAIAAVRDPSPETAFKIASGAGDIATGAASVLRGLASLAGSLQGDRARKSPGGGAGRPAAEPDDAWSAATRASGSAAGTAAGGSAAGTAASGSAAGTAASGSAAGTTARGSAAGTAGSAPAAEAGTSAAETGADPWAAATAASAREAEQARARARAAEEAVARAVSEARRVARDLLAGRVPGESRQTAGPANDREPARSPDGPEQNARTGSAPDDREPERSADVPKEKARTGSQADDRESERSRDVPEENARTGSPADDREGERSADVPTQNARTASAPDDRESERSADVPKETASKAAPAKAAAKRNGSARRVPGNRGKAGSDVWSVVTAEAAAQGPAAHRSVDHDLGASAPEDRDAGPGDDARDGDAV